ncbi:MAG: ATP-binding cassette domain-containing protein [Spirochaetes bacterium]|nr:ATP-binding cassette domain-containing protein [Spirochaetota bacterium]
MNEKIRIADLHKSFGRKAVLKGVTIDVLPGEIVCIVGKSGSGKSVIMKHLVGILRPDRGSIFVDGIDYTGADEENRRKIESQYGILFQGAALFDSMNVFDNVAFGLRRKRVGEDAVLRTVAEMLEKVGLRDVEEKMPSDLSGGMQKRVGLARSLAMDPEIMIYDEPTTGVDPITGGAVGRLIASTRETFGVTSIVVTHDMMLADRIADRIYMLNDGAIIFSGTASEFARTENPYVRQFVEGRAHGPIAVL